MSLKINCHELVSKCGWMLCWQGEKTSVVVCHFPVSFSSMTSWSFSAMAGPLCWGAVHCMEAWTILQYLFGNRPPGMFCACSPITSLFLSCFYGILQAEGLNWNAGLDLHGCSGKLCRLVSFEVLGFVFSFLFTGLDLDWSGVWRAIYETRLLKLLDPKKQLSKILLRIFV